MEAILYNKEAKKVGVIEAPEGIFGLPWNADFMHQVVTSMASNARLGLAHTKGRGEVRGGGRKPWAQKGTGQARHGSRRSPIWKGGGVTHGPLTQKVYGRKVNRSARQKALLVALSRKFKDGEIIFVDALAMKAPKTAEAKKMLNAFSEEFLGLKKSRNAALVVLPGAEQSATKSFYNFGNIEVADARNLNPVSVLGKKYVLIINPSDVLATLSKKTS